MKNPFFFRNVLKRWSFQKYRTAILSFLYYKERWYFFFPKIWSCSLVGKWKMIFLKKLDWNVIYYSNLLKKVVFSKKSHWNMIFLLSLGKIAFLFYEKKIFFIRMGSKSWSFSKNTWKYDVFYMLGKDGILFSYKNEIILLSNKQRCSFLTKYN